jgi:apolipoprotein N-acyltransferase
VRAANTGISGIVDPYGRVVTQSELFERRVLIGDVRLLDGRTVYSRTGDAFAYGCLFVLAAAWVATLRGGRAGPASR